MPSYEASAWYRVGAPKNTPADFGKLIADETEKLGKVVKFAVSSRS